MSLVHFAHNGVQHASQAEAAAHNTNTSLWIIAITLTTLAIGITIARTLGKSDQKPQEKEEKD